MFGRTTKKQLQEDLRRTIEARDEFARENQVLRNQVDYLIREIRKMDDMIFNISQQTGWETMRPRIAQLVDQMTARKVAESNRINSLITGELHKTYNDQTNAPKRITNLKGPAK